MQNGRLKVAILAGDLFWIPVALFGAYFLRHGGEVLTRLSDPAPSGFLLLLVMALAGWVLLFEFMELDCFRGGWQLPATISRMSMAAMLLLVLVVAWAFLIRLFYSRLILAYFGLLFWAGVVLLRLLALALLRMKRRAGKVRRVMLVGDDYLSQQLISRIRRHPELLYEVVGVLHPSSQVPFTNDSRADTNSSSMSSLDVIQFLNQLKVQELIVLLSQPVGIELQGFLVRCQAQGIHVCVLPQPYELYTSRPKLVEIDGVPLISLEGPRNPNGAALVKRAMDLALAFVLLVPGVLIVTLVGAILWLRERRFIRRELRCGRNGMPFPMLRLDVGSDGQDRSKFGEFLRRLSITELPQLWNVILGQMSLVGPRPESPERVRNYSDWQRQRLKVLPGMTGLAQVNGLREQHSSDRKTHYDLRYICEWNPIIDLVLLLQTIWTLVARFFERAPVVRRAADEPGSIPREGPSAQRTADVIAER